MNLAFYVESCGGTPQNTEIYNFLNGAVSDPGMKDAAVFFNSINFNPISVKFGMFDATELWHFNGNLVCTSIDNMRRSDRVVNSIKAVYLFSKDQKNERSIFDLVKIARAHRVIVLNEADQMEFYRISGVKPILLNGLSMNNFREVFDEQI